MFALRFATVDSSTNYSDWSAWHYFDTKSALETAKQTVLSNLTNEFVKFDARSKDNALAPTVSAYLQTRNGYKPCTLTGYLL